MNRRPAIGLCTALAVLAASARGADPEPPSAQAPLEFTARERQLIARHSPLPPPPPDPTNAFADDPRAAVLGQMLFFDTRLSGDGRHACATCHQPAKGLADGLPLGEGLSRGVRHTQGLWNVAYNRWFFWDGRADTLWAQALEPIERPDEMGGSRVQAARLIAEAPALRSAYERVFGPLPDAVAAASLPRAGRPVAGDAAHEHDRAWRGLSAAQRAGVDRVFANVGKAIAAYERRLVSRRSAFDVFAEGLATGDVEKQAALSPAAQRGLRLFLGRGNCRLCHSGPNFSDGEFHNVRVPPLGGGAPKDAGRYDGLRALLANPFNARGEFSDQRDGPAAGRLALLERRPSDWGLFKTPTLRNVALTAPYMHQGQFDTLQRVIEHYSTFNDALPAGHHEVDRTLEPLRLTPGEAADLLAFLESLTDVAIDPALLRPPAGAAVDGPRGRGGAKDPNAP
ncbi:MAG: hypothetical protein H3C42_15105 [Phycisphaerae bacterium]|nr:hypothetical protein [Phycisphaerae bacterium]